MIRLGLALAWMRWRILVNSISRRRKAARSARLSGWLALGSTALVTIAGLLIAIGIAAGAFAGGILLGSPQPPRAEVGLALRLLGFSALLIGLMTPLQVGENRAPTRLLLLPVPRLHLHAARLVSCLADPLVLFTAPAALAVLAGLAVGGRPVAALLALPAALALVAFLVGFDAFASIGAQVLLRDRRRGEAASLVVLLVMIVLGFVPMLVATRLDPDAARSSTTSAAPSRDAGLADIERSFGALDLLPPGLFARSLERSLDGRTGAALGHAGLLAAIAAGTLGLAASLHGRLLDEPGSSSRRRSSQAIPRARLALPGMRKEMLAVASVAARQALRTVRGKLAIITPAIVVAVMAFTFRRIGDAEPGLAGTFTTSAGLVSWAIALSMLNLQPLWLNAHATDRSGFTLLALQPVSEADVVRGKILAHGLMLGLAVALSLPPSWALGNPSPLAEIVVALACGLCTALVQAPLAIVISAWFPKEADLSKLSGQQPHGAATLLGLGILVVATLLPRLAWHAGSLAGPVAGWLALGSWLVASALAGRAFAGLAARELRARREEIALAARGC